MRLSRCVEKNSEQILNRPRNLDIHLVTHHQCPPPHVSSIAIAVPCLSCLQDGRAHLFGFADHKQSHFLLYWGWPGQRLPRRMKLRAAGGQSSPPDAVPAVLVFGCWTLAGPAEQGRGFRKRGGGRTGPLHNPQTGLRFMRILLFRNKSLKMTSDLQWSDGTVIFQYQQSSNTGNGKRED